MWIFMFIFLSAALACEQDLNRDIVSNVTTYPKVTVGPEGSDPATTAYQLNHVTINSHNLTRTVDFYNQVFGMRLMFTVQVTENLSFAYMGHSSGGKNGTGYQTTDEMIRQQTNSQGFLEVIYINTSDNGFPASTISTNTFSHIGLVVPDIEIVQNRLQSLGVTIYKGVGDQFPVEGPVINACALQSSKFSPEEFKTIVATMTEMTKGVIFAADHDGNMLEIVQKAG